MAVVYRHLKPCGEVFYIGIGNDKDRAYSKRGRNKFWKRGEYLSFYRSYL